MGSIDLRDIISLTDFQRNAKQHIVRLTRTGKAQVLTVNGKAALVVQDAEAYQKLLDQAEAGRNKTLSIVAGSVPPPVPSAAARAEPPVVHVMPAARPAQQVETKPEARHDQTSAIAAAMQELRKNFSKK
ncbi:MAG: type II toxin-antitoxin system Phd/YefM family antitoxin [Phycisphaerales bacterium]